MIRAALLAALGVALLPAQDRSAGARPDLDALLAQLDDADAARRSQAYSALLRQRSEPLLQRLVAALPQMSLPGQSLGLSLLQGFPDDQEHAALRLLVRAKSPFLELGAAAILLRAGDGGQIQHVVGPLQREDVDPSTRRAMLYRIQGLHEARVDAAVLALVTPATDPGVLDGALGYLLQPQVAGGQRAAATIADAAEVDAQTRAVAAAFLLARGDGSRSGAVVAALQDGAVLSRMQRFLLAAPQLPPPVLSALAELAGSATISYQATMAMAVLAQKGGEQQIPLFQKLAMHKDAQVAKAALEALQQRGVPVSARAIADMLADPNPQSALNAADLLRRNDDLSGLPRVLELAGTAGTHQAEAMRVLGRFRVPDAVPPLLEGLMAAERDVRTAATQALAILLPSLHPYRRFDLASTGYAAEAGEAARAQAVARIRAWWERNRPQ